MFGMALTRPSLTMTSGVDVFAHVCRQKVDTSSNWDNIQPWQEIFQFLSNVTRFLFFFRNLPQIQTSKFCKVVQQHTKGMFGRIMWVLLKIYFSFQQW